MPTEILLPRLGISTQRAFRVCAGKEIFTYFQMGNIYVLSDTAACLASLCGSRKSQFEEFGCIPEVNRKGKAAAAAKHRPPQRRESGAPATAAKHQHRQQPHPLVHCKMTCNALYFHPRSSTQYVIDPKIFHLHSNCLSAAFSCQIHDVVVGDLHHEQAG